MAHLCNVNWNNSWTVLVNSYSKVADKCLFVVNVVSGADQKYAVHYHITPQQHVRVGRSTYRHLQDTRLHQISCHKSIQRCVSKWVVSNGLVLLWRVSWHPDTVQHHQLFNVLLNNMKIDTLTTILIIQFFVYERFHVVTLRKCDRLGSSVKCQLFLIIAICIYWNST